MYPIIVVSCHYAIFTGVEPFENIKYEKLAIIMPNSDIIVPIFSFPFIGILRKYFEYSKFITIRAASIIRKIDAGIKLRAISWNVKANTSQRAEIIKISF